MDRGSAGATGAFFSESGRDARRSASASSRARDSARATESSCACSSACLRIWPDWYIEKPMKMAAMRMKPMMEFLSITLRPPRPS